MKKRCEWRGIEAEVQTFQITDSIDFSDLDIVLLGGGSDREQMLVCEKLKIIQPDFKAYIEDNGTVIAVCGGYQLLGHYYDTDQGRIEGLSLVDLYTEQGSPRLISNIVIENEMFEYPIVGLKIMEDVLLPATVGRLEKYCSDMEIMKRTGQKGSCTKMSSGHICTVLFCLRILISVIISSRTRWSGNTENQILLLLMIRRNGRQTAIS